MHTHRAFSIIVPIAPSDRRVLKPGVYILFLPCSGMGTLYLPNFPVGCFDVDSICTGWSFSDSRNQTRYGNRSPFELVLEEYTLGESDMHFH